MFMTIFYYCVFYFVTYIVIEALAILWRTPYLQATDDEDACSVCFALYLLAHQLVELVVIVGIGHTCRAGSPLFPRRPVQAPDVGAAAEADFELAGERAVPPPMPPITTIELCRLSGRDFDGSSPIARRSDPAPEFSENSADDRTLSYRSSYRSEDMPINLVVLNPGDREVTSPGESSHEEMQEMQEMQREIGESTLPTTTSVPITTAAAAAAAAASTPAPAPAPFSNAAAAAAATSTATVDATPDGPSPIHSRMRNAQASFLASVQG